MIEDTYTHPITGSVWTKFRNEVYPLCSKCRATIAHNDGRIVSVEAWESLKRECNKCLIKRLYGKGEKLNDR